MAEQQISSGQIVFQTEGRLLQELGERLVASPEVALVELVKNSFDADATSCTVAFGTQNDTLVIRDDGMGMTFDNFANRWMRIATSNKLEDRESPRFHRKLTGQKGIGRFAVRYLGKALELESVAWDTDRNLYTRLVAGFDWEELDKHPSLNGAQIPYRLTKAADSVTTGTTLTIQSLKVQPDFASSTEFRTSVLKIVSPLRALDGGRFRLAPAGRSKDPGFSLGLPGDTQTFDGEFDLASQILEHAWGKLLIDLTSDTLTYHVHISGEKISERLRVKVKPLIRGGLVADIRFFPRRAGIFQATEVNGQQAWKWVRENYGIAVVDHGFRIRPYGLVDDDWLTLNADSAHNERNWRSTISQKHFPIPPEVRQTGENPMLNLPSNFQLVGAVFVESSASGSGSDDDLITSMDREGFLSNDAFRQLTDIVRGGIEYLARADRAATQREAERRAKEAAKRTRADLRAAVEYIEKSPTLTRADKSRLVEEYSGLARRLDEVEEYDREARRKLETMSALGVVAGFMTHETARIVAALKETIDDLNRIAKSHPSVRKKIVQLERSYDALKAHLDYARTFIDATQRGQAASFKAAPQVRLIIDRFGNFARDRGIQVLCDIDPSIDAPHMPISAYSGILLNLYTNALKAIMATRISPASSKIVFKAHNDARWHVVEVLDTGVGIPPNLRERIWDTLFTTTSRLNNPLGSGMGLGLTLVQQLVEQMGGKIDLVDAPPEFSTCFRVQLPRQIM